MKKIHYAPLICLAALCSCNKDNAKPMKEAEGSRANIAEASSNHGQGKILATNLEHILHILEVNEKVENVFYLGYSAQRFKEPGVIQHVRDIEKEMKRWEDPEYVARAKHLHERIEQLRHVVQEDLAYIEISKEIEAYKQKGIELDLKMSSKEHHEYWVVGWAKLEKKRGEIYEKLSNFYFDTNATTEVSFEALVEFRDLRNKQFVESMEKQTERKSIP